MPLYLNKQVGEDTVLAIWKITEPKDELLKLIDDKFYEAEFKKENLHWLASRALINKLFQHKNIELIKDLFNKPSLKIDGAEYHISITHSFQYAAIIVSKLQTVSIDMEKVDTRIERVKHKFMRDDELRFINDQHAVEMLVTIWSAKETLYKFYGKKELDFKGNLKIEHFNFSNLFELKGDVSKESFLQSFNIQVEFIDGYILTYIC